MGNIQKLFSGDQNTANSGTAGRVLSVPNVSTAPHPGSANHKRPNPTSSHRKHVSVGGIHVSIVKGDFYKEKADVIINSVPPDMNLSKGGGSQALLQAAGPHIQTECYNTHPQGTRLKEGELVVTGSGNLKCRKIYHVVLPKWKGPSDVKMLTSIMMKCLETAEKFRVKTIVSPDLSTGFHGFPADVSASALFQAISDFHSKHSQTKISNITFVVHFPRNAQFKAFEHEARKWSQKTTGAASRNLPRKFTSVGNLSVTVVSGELSDQQVDVIVNNTGTDLQLKNGGLAESLLRVAGDRLQNECDNSYPNGVQPGAIAVTGGYKLKCKKVYHGALPQYDPASQTTQSMEQFINNCLTEANSHGSRSIAFPALGTGALKYPEDVSAKTICKCISNFQKVLPSATITDIRIVVYDKAKTGNSSAVKQALIRELTSISTQPSPAAPFAKKAPAAPIAKRGTKAFFSQKYQEELHPPSYWTSINSKMSLKRLNSQTSPGVPYKVVQVDKKTQDAVAKLVDSTWKQQFIGHGKDAAGLDKLSFTKLSVKKVERIENPFLFEKYAQGRAQLFNKAASSGPFSPVENLPNANGPVLTTSTVIPSELTDDICPEINEHFMFHGTQDAKVNAIMSNGLDCRVANNFAVLGMGVYCAESSTKSDQYADPKQNRTLNNKKMLLVRMCLGDIFLMTTAQKLKRPPCTTCKVDTCNTHHVFFDSVVIDGQWNFREFVVYDQSKCYPEYLITYDRV